MIKVLFGNDIILPKNFGTAKIIPERLLTFPHQLLETPLGRFGRLLFKTDLQTLVHNVSGNLNTLCWIMCLCWLLGKMIPHLKKVASLYSTTTYILYFVRIKNLFGEVMNYFTAPDIGRGRLL